MPPSLNLSDQERKARKAVLRRAYYIAHREQELARAKEYFKKHPEVNRESARRHYAANKERVNQRNCARYHRKKAEAAAAAAVRIEA